MPMLFHVFVKVFDGGVGYKVRKRMFFFCSALKEKRHISLAQGNTNTS